MNDSPYSDALIEWAAMAGRAVSLRDGIWVLADLGGEIRYYLHSANVHTLTQVERGGPERFLVSAMNIADIERYLVTELGFCIRSTKKLPYIFLNGKPGPATIDDIAPGYTVEEPSPGRVSLIDGNGIRAVFAGNLPTNVRDAVEFSWVADADLADIRASYLDPDGLPLFPHCTIRHP